MEGFGRFWGGANTWKEEIIDFSGDDIDKWGESLLTEFMHYINLLKISFYKEEFHHELYHRNKKSHKEIWKSNWIPVFLLFFIAILLSSVSYFLAQLEISSKVLFQTGKAYGGKLLSSSFDLNVKLSTVSFIVGLVTMFITAASYGAVMGNIDGFIEGNELYQQLLLMIE